MCACYRKSLDVYIYTIPDILAELFFGVITREISDDISLLLSYAIK